jgi:hypothetical protein
MLVRQGIEMTTYRYTVRAGVDIDDIQVSEHDTPADARREAIGILERLFGVLSPETSDKWVVEVADRAGLVLFTVTLVLTSFPGFDSF